MEKKYISLIIIIITCILSVSLIVIINNNKNNGNNNNNTPNNSNSEIKMNYDRVLEYANSLYGNNDNKVEVKEEKDFFIINVYDKENKLIKSFNLSKKDNSIIENNKNNFSSSSSSNGE